MTDSPQSEHPAPTTLLEATNLLSDRVLHLTERLDISDRIARLTRVLSIGGLVALVVFAAFGFVQFRRVTDSLDRAQVALEQAQRAIDGNSANAIQSCQNANETRAANLQLWNTILSYIRASSDPATDEKLGELQAWIAVLYQPHDCDDLSREYKIPDPPDLSDGGGDAPP